MPDQLQLRGGTTAQHASFTGVSKEVTIDTTKKTAVVHDGTTAGGNPLLREDASNSALALGSAGTPSLKFTGDTNTGIYSPGADQVAISTGGSGRLFINSAGNVGIGAANTGAAFLEVNGSLRWQTQGIFRNSTNTSTLLRFAEIGSRDVRLDTWDGTDFNGTIRHGAQTYLVETGTGASLTERLRITSAGLVGVGTSSPSANLESQGNVSSTTQFSGFQGLRIQNANGSAFGVTADINFVVGTGTDNRGAVIGAEYTSATSGNDLYFATNPNAVTANDTPIERMRITSAGRVGIGASAPANVLEVAGNNSAGNGIGNVQGILRINNNTTAFGSSPTAGIVFATKYRTSPDIPLDGAAIYGGKENTSDANKSFFLAFATRAESGNNGNEAMRIDSQGRVGIGTTTPARLLEVQNTNAATDGFARISSTNNGAFLEFAPAGSNTIRHYTVGSAVGGSLIFYDTTANSQRAAIDSSGRLLVGTSSGRGVGSTVQLLSQIESTSGNYPGLAITQNGADSGAGYLHFGKTRGTSVGSNTIVQSGDRLGSIRFAGADGTDLESVGAEIEAYVDGTPGANDMPGRLVFSVTRDGAASPSEAVRISNTGRIDSFAAATAYCNSIGSAAGAGTTYAFIEGTYGRTSNGSGGTASFYVWTNGNVQNTNNSYTAISDLKLKENVVDAGSQWDDLKALRVRNYNLKEGQTHRQIGLIAQEVEPISPGLVYESPDRDEEGNDLGTVTKSVNYSVLYMKAVKALQEAMERIEQLEAKVAALESA